MIYPDEDLIPISALQHYLFCPRQCALIHVEQIWSENLATAEGRLMHERVHEEGEEHRPGVTIERGMPLRSLVLGLTGQTDVVEYHTGGTVIPIEYKRGKPKTGLQDEVQLCAQALCLEEMLEQAIPRGYLYYGKPRRRTEVIFDATLRGKTTETISNVRTLLDTGQTPAPLWLKKRCPECSIIEYCFPEKMAGRPAITAYLARCMKDGEKERQ